MPQARYVEEELCRGRVHSGQGTQGAHFAWDALRSGRGTHVAGVVDEAEAGLVAEVGLHEFWVRRVLQDELVDERLVRRLREPALLVDQRQDAHRLRARRTGQQHTRATRCWQAVVTLRRHFFELLTNCVELPFNRKVR